MSFNDRHNPFPKYQNIKSYTEEIIIYIWKLSFAKINIPESALPDVIMNTYNFTLF